MNINNKCINHLRCLSAEMITNANSGHPGVALGSATIFYALFKDHYFYDIKDHNFIARDRFVASAGHVSALYYATAYMFNFGLGENDLRSFRQLNSATPGHPEYKVTNFVETSTGPLGQGVANAVGMAIAETMLAQRFNAQKYPVFDNFVYCFAGDGCLMEGVAQEALSLAGTLKLNKFILLYDYNNMTIDGKAEETNAEDIRKKFKSMHFNVIYVRNGNNYNSVTRAIAKAKKCQDKPTVIIFKTIIGYGADTAGQNAIHGKPLSTQELSALKQRLGVKESFSLPSDIKEYVLKTSQKNSTLIEKWNNMFAVYKTANPELYKQLVAFLSNKEIDIQKLIREDLITQDLSGRDANSIILSDISQKMPRFVGGTADVAASTKVYLKNGGDYSSHNRKGKNIHYGIREHAMGAISNGLSLVLKSPVFCSTFLAFSNYMLPPIRMSALMNLPVWYIFSHDSYKIGEDGPSHQSVEQLGTLRLIPNLNVYRPAFTKEIYACYDLALNSSGPSAFALARQTLKSQDADYDFIKKGGYVLSGDTGDIEILATGSEVELAVKVKDMLGSQDIKCVVASFPCLEQFDRQPKAYKDNVLSRGKLLVSLEASDDNIWYKYIGKDGLRIGVDNFGKSAKPADLDEYFGMTASKIAKKLKNYLNK